ncbi:MAG: DUF4381 domain-containing protein [Methylococcales bacterium]|jgi:hypothetical protein|nr:DUF4381 domain-containing protein [Methylococcales bacterium]MBT7445504.1 DUF4381 domain-containing protein [Methylococcales bacterium]
MKRSEALSSLRDIQGIDVDLGLPDSITYLFIAGLITLLAYLLWYFVIQKGNWRQDARTQLDALQKHLKNASGREVLTEFTELLRRIAMARKGRKACAGLSGDDWISWLQDKDPKGFKWSAYSDYLANLSYAPASVKVDENIMKQLIVAAKQWTYKD